MGGEEKKGEGEGRRKKKRRDVKHSSLSAGAGGKSKIEWRRKNKKNISYIEIWAQKGRKNQKKG